MTTHDDSRSRQRRKDFIRRFRRFRRFAQMKEALFEPGERPVRWYRTLIEGTDFLREMDGHRTYCGFFTTRILKTTTADEAIELAFESVLDELRRSRVV